jgi:uncharacterized protein YndB with AHSA1/START domain
MVDILHRVGIEACVADVYEALTTVQGLSDWWTEDTHGDSAVGGVLEFRFDVGGFDMTVLEQQPNRILWRVTQGPDEWVGTTISWDLSQVDEWAIVLVETGKGSPAPLDLKISNWH